MYRRRRLRKAAESLGERTGVFGVSLTAILTSVEVLHYLDKDVNWANFDNPAIIGNC